MNVDASWVPGEFLCSVARIVRDGAGCVVDGFAAEARVSLAPHAEAEALLHGIRYLKELKSRHVREAKNQEIGRAHV